MTLEDQIKFHNEFARRATQILERMVGVMEKADEEGRQMQQSIARHDAMLETLTSISERQQELLEEVRRDAQQTQNLWVKLAGKYGWLDDLD